MDERVTAPRKGAPYDPDEALRVALNVDPSPEFLAKIRARVAAEPEPSRWRLAWVMAPFAASVLAVLAVPALWPRVEPAAPAAPVQAVAPAVVEPPVPLPPVAPSGGRLQAARNRARVAERVVEPSRAIEREVLIAESERRGFEILLAALQQNALPPVPEGAPAPEPTAIEIRPFTIEPVLITRLVSEETNQ